jgi:DNA-binding MarR family transcriptional regulator
MGRVTRTPDRLSGDLGWGLAVVFRAYVKAADTIADEIPGGNRGYQVLSAAALDDPGSQAAMAQRLGIDRTVMTYLLDDLESAHLVERQADPADRRTRRVVATPHGRDVLATLDERFAQAEQHLMGPLPPADQDQFRRLLREVAAHANDRDPVPSACDAVDDLTSRLFFLTRLEVTGQPSRTARVAHRPVRPGRAGDGAARSAQKVGGRAHTCTPAAHLHPCPQATCPQSAASDSVTSAIN